MAKQSEGNQPRNAGKVEPRESDNPVLEDFKEEVWRRPGIGPHSGAGSESERLVKLEGLLACLLYTSPS
ncbi:MAG: hypothetical protein QUS09_10680, partial [Methanotrichaceae archaeon]|nr:hypothetical protein [Methanotrichaceae archaeon]